MSNNNRFQEHHKFKIYSPSFEIIIDLIISVASNFEHDYFFFLHIFNLPFYKMDFKSMWIWAIYIQESILSSLIVRINFEPKDLFNYIQILMQQNCLSKVYTSQARPGQMTACDGNYGMNPKEWIHKRYYFFFSIVYIEWNTMRQQCIEAKPISISIYTNSVFAFVRVCACVCLLYQCVYLSRPLWDNQCSVSRRRYLLTWIGSIQQVIIIVIILTKNI